jgi:hypothetical protein
MTTTKQGQPSPMPGKKDKQREDPAQGGRKATGSAAPDEDPEKKISIDDDPEQTKRKIPHMNK